MTDTDQQITPADATIVSTGTGTKGPEERELPESLSNDMSLCLRILRDVLGEYDPQLLATFDTVRRRHHRCDESARRPAARPRIRHIFPPRQPE